MIFSTHNISTKPTVILLHGGGLSSWSLNEVCALLKDKYNIITPIIDGHGDDFENTFISIQHSASSLIKYINTYHNGSVFAIGGLSIGAQIVVEAISQQPDIAQKVVIESGLIFPITGTKALTVPMFSLCYGLINKRWFAKMQAMALYLPDSMFEQYFNDSKKISKQSLINISLSNGSYSLNPSVAKATAASLIIVGEKELRIMKKSARTLHQTLLNSTLYVAKNMKHGQLSCTHPDEYVSLIEGFFSKP